MGSYDPRHNNNTFALAPSDGPYNVLDEQQYFQPGAGGHVNAGGEPGSGIIFQPETGNFATPPYASLHRFLSPDVVADFPKRGADPEGHVNGSNVVWNYHKYLLRPTFLLTLSLFRSRDVFDGVGTSRPRRRRRWRTSR